MKSSPEKSLTKLWPSLEAEFWTSLANNAPNPRYAQLYAIQLGLVGIPLEKRREYYGTEIHVGVKGVKKLCPKCLKSYEHVHPSEDSFCPCEWPPVRLQLPDRIAAVMEATLRFYMKNGIPLK